MHYDFEFGGGLGDILDQLYDRRVGLQLLQLQPDDTATIWLVTHNPFAQELFAHHPKKDQLTVVPCGYWPPSEDAAQRAERGMPGPGMNRRYGINHGPIDFYPAPESQQVINTLPDNYLVLAAGAGMLERVIPDHILHSILAYFEHEVPLPIVAIGRTYDRDNRYEPRMFGYPNVIDLVDRLDVPGTCQVVQSARGLITAHSSMAILGWLEDIPELLLYPESVLAHHAPNGQPDHWLRGTRSSKTVHARFDEAQLDHLAHFSRLV